MEIRLETKRLLLRPARFADKDAYREIRNSEYVMKYNAMVPITEEEAAAQLKKDMDSGRAFYLEQKSTGTLTGAVWLAGDSLRWQVPALTLEYFLGEEFAGQGLMTEALGAVLSYGFSTTEAQLISARTFAENKASQRVLEKLGFQREGVLRRAVKGYGGVVFDDVLFSLLREEWEAVQ